MKESFHFGTELGDVRVPETLRGTAEEMKWKPPSSKEDRRGRTKPGLRVKCATGQHLQCNASSCSCSCHTAKL